MTSDPAVGFRFASSAAQRIAGVIAARARGDLEGAETLLAGMDVDERAAGGLFLSDVTIALLARSSQCEVADMAAELSLHLAGSTPDITG